MSETFTQHFLENVKKYGTEKVAIRQKEYGIWQEFSWQDSYEQVRAFALGLIELGLVRGEKVSTIGDNDKQYLWGYLGVHALGGTIVGMYTDATATEAAYLVGDSDSVYVLAQDQEQVDKMLEVREQIPAVRRVIYWDESGLWNYDDPWLISFDEVQEMGRKRLASEPTRFEDEIALGKAEDVALISYTSGTTGLPKGAMMSHANMLTGVDAGQEIDPRYDTDNHVSFLPMGWIVEHLLGIANHCKIGIILNFPEEPETVRSDLREIAPESVVYSAGLWDQIVSLVQVRMQDATWINKLMYRAFMPIGYRAADRKLEGKSLGLLAPLYALGDLVFFGPLRDQLGLSKVRTALTGGAALSPDVIRFFHGIGVNLKQVYGMTEVTTIGTAHRNGDIKFASVGPTMPTTQVRIEEESGEILFTTPCLFQGYYKNPEKTAEALLVDEDGTRWFKTGDAGYVDDDGHLIYLDRVKDMIELANGARFSPQFIEGRLKFSPYIKDVMAVGDTSRESVAAMVIMEFDNISHWAEQRGIGFTTFADLSQKEPVRDLVKNVVNEVNESLPDEGEVKSFVLMPKEFDADEAEMTRSRKLKRQVLADKYDDIISALYGSDDTMTFRSEVKYQDGSVAQLENEINVVRV